MPGACMRNSARDKVMRKEADIRKVMIRLQEFPLAFPEHPPPQKIRICLLFHSSDILWKNSTLRALVFCI